jgi:segregation and condensation protein B
VTKIDTSTENTENISVDQFELEDQKGIIEALIFTASDPINLNQLAKASNLTKISVEQIIAELNTEYINTRRCFRIENIAGGYRMYTLPEYHSFVNQINVIERSHRISPAALEALAVIAYKQPITRVEIERIRGVDCGGVLKNLMSKNLIIIDGRSPAPGKPLLYRTSEYFLEFFGLPSLDHLPVLTEIEDHTQGLPGLKLVKAGEDSDNGDYSENDLEEDNPAEIDASEEYAGQSEDFDVDVDGPAAETVENSNLET